MNEVSLEQKIKNIERIVSHKHYLLDSCAKMAIYLMEHENENLALKLMERSFNHDMSKLCFSEFYPMSTFSDDNSSLKNPLTPLSEEQKSYLKIHWKHNSHHPEYWEDLNKMGELDIIEMVCDWHCRSVEFGTNLIKFVEIRQETRFHLPESIYDKVMYYCKIISNL